MCNFGFFLNFLIFFAIRRVQPPKSQSKVTDPTSSVGNLNRLRIVYKLIEAPIDNDAIKAATILTDLEIRKIIISISRLKSVPYTKIALNMLEWYENVTAEYLNRSHSSN